MRQIAVFALSGLLMAQTASADVNARFIEGAPKDRFEISSVSECLKGPLTVTIDLTGSAGGLIFDTTGQGAGVEVFQPFELVSGTDMVVQAPAVLDGDKALSLGLSGLPKDQVIAFTLDVDDTGGAREITVSGGEISGASLIVQTEDSVRSAIFDKDATATLTQSLCTS